MSESSQPQIQATENRLETEEALNPEPEQEPEDAAWVDIRCYNCGRIRGKMTAYPILEGVQEAVKIGVEVWCRYCHLLTYKTFVV